MKCIIRSAVSPLESSLRMMILRETNPIRSGFDTARKVRVIAKTHKCCYTDRGRGGGGAGGLKPPHFLARGKKNKSCGKLKL